MEEATDGGTARTDAHLDGPAALAFRALLDHTQTCVQCIADSRKCATGRVLVRTVRQARQG
ncbi:hypothetical protein [Streptomyces fructofermentans]|uniref:Uncharacterized protein n=1 Tax=Streptomyces fructofermentans TaxID=152141 RepID=A0A918NAT2_9ACTN|nr:hypothetical protein [Streptomyces fructofermentans]GGX54189.1 hypothetical protein GCM10010515_21760 [Streptomyces fructofermentans]